MFCCSSLNFAHRAVDRRTRLLVGHAVIVRYCCAVTPPQWDYKTIAAALIPRLPLSLLVTETFPRSLTMVASESKTQMTYVSLGARKTRSVGEQARR